MQHLFDCEQDLCFWEIFLIMSNIYDYYDKWVIPMIMSNIYDCERFLWFWLIPRLWVISLITRSNIRDRMFNSALLFLQLFPPGQQLLPTLLYTTLHYYYIISLLVIIYLHYAQNEHCWTPVLGLRLGLYFPKSKNNNKNPHKIF